MSIDAFKELATSYVARISYAHPVFLDSDRIAFLDTTSGTDQASYVTLSTGAITPITSYGERLISLLASPTAGRIVFGMDLAGNERQQLYSIEELGTEPKRLTPDENAFYEPGPLSDTGDAVLYRTNDRDEGSFDIVVQRLPGGDTETWLENGGQVQPIDLHGDRALVYKRIYNMDADLLMIERGGAVTNLTPHEGEQWVYHARFDRHGSGVYLLSSLDRDFVALLYLDPVTGNKRTVFEAAGDVDRFAISPDGKWAAVATNEGGWRKPYLVPLNGADAIEIEAAIGTIEQFSWSPDSQSVAFDLSSIERPSAIYLADLSGASRLIASGDAPNPPATVPAEPITYTSFDGRTIHGFFLKPQSDGPFPALVEIHGGPEGQRMLNYYLTGDMIQYLVSMGIAVLSLNVRGSTGYGKEYCHLDDKEKRLDAVKDVAYAAQWLKERPDIIGDKLAVYGISYGGFMTLSALTRYPDLWAAGVEMVGMASLVTFMERTGPWRRPHRETEYGVLETQREMMESVSPLPLVDRISAPLMVFHGRQDARVPLYESELIVKAVQERGYDVEFIVYDDEGHVFNKRPNLIDAFARIGAFLTKHLL
jgi:dipeptidyl aminopeptidase/acylaminoacyl peptidase